MTLDRWRKGMDDSEARRSRFQLPIPCDFETCQEGGNGSCPPIIDRPGEAASRGRNGWDTTYSTLKTSRDSMNEE